MKIDGVRINEGFDVNLCFGPEVPQEEIDYFKKMFIDRGETVNVIRVEGPSDRICHIDLNKD
jgi:hypothetical protein